MAQFGSALTLFFSLLAEAMPFLILGVLVSGLLMLLYAIATIIALVFSTQSDLKPFLQPAIAAAMSQSDTDLETPTLLKSGTFLLGQLGKPSELDAANLQAALTANPTTKLSIKVPPALG
ncbi:MAG: hypothetical protein ACFCU8_20650 [Thermosynechococcaceae cyanobacterium]